MIKLSGWARFLRIIFYALSIYFFILVGIYFNITIQNQTPHYPPTAEGYYRHAKVLGNQGKYSEAEDLLKKAVTLNPSHYRAMMEMGCDYWNQAEFVQGLVWFERALKYVGKDRSNTEILYYDLGKMYLYEHKSDKAWDYLRRSYEMKKFLGKSNWPDDASDPLYYVMKSDRKKFDDSVKDYSTNEIYEKDRQIRQWANFGFSQKVLDDVRGYLDRNPGTYYTDFFIRWEVSASLRLKEYDQTLHYLEALKQYPMKTKDKVWVAEKFYEIYLYKKDFPKAIEAMHQLLTDYPKDVTVAWSESELAHIYREMGDLAKEKALYLDIIENHPKSKQAYSSRERLVEILTAQGQYAEAYKYIKEMFSFKQSLMMVVAVVLFIGFLVFVFFVFSRIFFIKKLESIKESGLRLRHLWLIASGLALISAFVSLIFFFLNDLLHDGLAKIYVNPFLAGILLMDSLTAFICIWWLRKRYGWDNQKLGFVSKGNWIDLGLPCLTALGLIIFAILWDMFLLNVLRMPFPPHHPMEDFIQDTFSNAYLIPKVLMTLAVVVATPLCEEFFFRIFLFNFLKTYTNTFWAVVFQAFIFACGHNMPSAIPYYFVVGVVFNLFYIRTGSIYPAVVAHACLNLIGIIFT